MIRIKETLPFIKTGSYVCNEITIATYGDNVLVFDAVTTRTSVRSFLDEPVEQAVLEKLIHTASRAPSGTNMQPWETHVFTGNALKDLCAVVTEAYDKHPTGNDSEVRYYPEKWFEPFISRRRKVGWDLYGLLNIEKGDKVRMHEQHRRNFQFFDAPVGMLFTIHRDLATGSWLDYGMYLQNLMLLARSFDLHTCPQAAWADFHTQIRKHMALSEDHVIVCGMALGKMDPNAPENTLRTEREPIEKNTHFYD